MSFKGNWIKSLQNKSAHYRVLRKVKDLIIALKANRVPANVEETHGMGSAIARISPPSTFLTMRI